MKVAAATAGCVIFGSAGLAAAGTLPATVQDAAHTALGAVGVNVPEGHGRFNDPTICPGGPYKNHGQYVKAHPNDPKAAQSPCGKPLQSVDTDAPDSSTPATDADKSKSTHGHDKTSSTKGNPSDTAPGQSDTTKVHGPPTSKKAPETHAPNTTHTTGPDTTHPTGPPSSTIPK
jgi:hypothetical protein